MNNILARSIRCKSLLNKRFIHISPGVMNAKVAVVLSGCGVYDGTEVHEASACLVHLSRAGAKVSMYAPNIDQMHTIDHTRGEEMEPNRSVLCESARIARGEVASLTELKSSEFDAVIIPGGFGAAKNLCSWAVDNVSCKVNDEVKRVIQEFQESGKPIGLSCIAPVLAAKCIPGVEVTVGHATDEGGMWPYAGTAGAMEQCGAKHVQKEVTEAHTDVTKKVVTTPAFMCNAPVHKVYDGIGEMISGTLKLVKQ